MVIYGSSVCDSGMGWPQSGHRQEHLLGGFAGPKKYFSRGYSDLHGYIESRRPSTQPSSTNKIPDPTTSQAVAAAAPVMEKFKQPPPLKESPPALKKAATSAPKPNPPKTMPTASAPAAPLPPLRRPVHPVDMWILWVCLQRLPLRILGVAKAGVAKPENILSNGRLPLRILNMWFSLVPRAVEPRLQWLQLHPWCRNDLQMDTQDQPVSAASNSLNSTQ